MKLRLFEWFNEIWHWLGKGKIVFMCILVIVAVVTLGVVTWCSESSIRSAGFMLQILGMVFAIRGLLGIRAHFRQTPLRKLFFNWLKRFPRWRRGVVHLSGTSIAAASSVSGRVDVHMPDDPNQPLEKRIENIVENLNQVRKEMAQHDKSIDDLKERQEEHKKIVAAQNKKLEANIRSDLELLHTNDLLTSLVGGIWLIVGISMSTMAPELFEWLK